MAKLIAAEITTDHDAYARQRPDVRRTMIAMRAQRRVRVGDVLEVEFENVDTLRYQVQEMVHVERITAPAEVAAEVETYARLLPSSHELSATLMIALGSAATAKSDLAALHGVQHAVSLVIDGVRVPAREVLGPDEAADADRADTVSVHMMRFPLTDAQRDAFRDPDVKVELAVDHPAYSEATRIAGATRLALIADLALG